MTPEKPTTADRFADRAAMLAAMQRAGEIARWKHAILGREVCVWRDGRVEWLRTALSDVRPDDIRWYDV